MSLYDKDYNRTQRNIRAFGAGVLIIAWVAFFIEVLV